MRNFYSFVVRMAATCAVSMGIIATRTAAIGAAGSNNILIAAAATCAQRTGRATTWLPQMLLRLERHHALKDSLGDCRVLQDAKGNVFLATRWYARESPVRDTFKLYRIELQRGKPPVAVFILGYTAPYLRITDPTGNNPAGDSVPMLFVEGGAGGLNPWDANLHIIRLIPDPIDVTPANYGQVVSAMQDGGGTHDVVAFDHRWDIVFDPSSVGGYVSAPTVLTWRNGRYEPNCRERSDFLQNLYAPPKPETYQADLLHYLAFTMRDAFILAQSGETKRALEFAEAAIEEAKRRGPDWPDWKEKGEEDWYLSVVTDLELSLLPAFRAVVESVDVPCPLAALGPPEFRPLRHEARLEPIPWTADQDVR